MDAMVAAFGGGGERVSAPDDGAFVGTLDA
jgi:hypothetical protein